MQNWIKDFVLFSFKFKIITFLEFDLARWIEMMILYILKVIKGIKKLLHEGFVYQINGVVGETSYWLCEQRLEKCCGRLIVKMGS